MNKIKKCFVITLIVALIPMLAACGNNNIKASGTSVDVNKTQQVASNLAQNQPSPT